ncbi:MAG: succinate dehydrogenase/fumarate reductase iron-sulfur subunit [Myxococcota bacterium]
MNLTLKVWRQEAPDKAGAFKTYTVQGVTEELSMLDVLDVLNEELLSKGERPVAYEHDCREGICGSCGCMVDGVAHGPTTRATLCQLHMRTYRDGDTITLEPFRADAFPIVRDLIVDRSSLDKIIQAGGYISVRTGAAPDAHAIQVGKQFADRAFAAAACIGCGACVAACPNASAMLFTAAKVTHLSEVPQGHPERTQRVLNMIAVHDEQGFGACSNHGECAAVCPKGIDLSMIAQLNREYLRAMTAEAS